MEKAEGKGEKAWVPKGGKLKNICGFKSLRKEGFGRGLLPVSQTVSQNRHLNSRKSDESMKKMRRCRETFFLPGL